jgi:hypothetical protein
MEFRKSILAGREITARFGHIRIDDDSAAGSASDM